MNTPFTKTELEALKRKVEWSYARFELMELPVVQVKRLIEAAELSMPPVPELAGKYPVVLYFETQAECDELIEMVKQAKPHLAERKLS